MNIKKVMQVKNSKEEMSLSLNNYFILKKLVYKDFLGGNHEIFRIETKANTFLFNNHEIIGNTPKDIEKEILDFMQNTFEIISSNISNNFKNGYLY